MPYQESGAVGGAGSPCARPNGSRPTLARWTVVSCGRDHFAVSAGERLLLSGLSLTPHDGPGGSVRCGEGKRTSDQCGTAPATRLFGVSRVAALHGKPYWMALSPSRRTSLASRDDMTSGRTSSIEAPLIPRHGRVPRASMATGDFARRAGISKGSKALARPHLPAYGAGG